MPVFTSANQVYMLPSGFWVVAELARGEVVSGGVGTVPFLTDAQGDDLIAAININVSAGYSGMWRNGMFHVVKDNADAVDDLVNIEGEVSTITQNPNFVDAVWSAGSPVSTVTMSNLVDFTEDDREQLEIAVQKAMQYMGMYYDIQSVVRSNPVMTVTLDETQKPYDAGWDSVWAETAAMFGGELP